MPTMFRKHHFFILLLPLIFSSGLSSQSARSQALIDSTWNNIRNKIKADSFVRLCYNYAIQNNEYWGQYNAQYLRGRINEVHNDPDSALHYYNEALNIAKSNNNKGDIGKALSNKSYAKEMLGERDEAIKMTQNSLEVFLELNDSVNIQDGYRRLGYFYNNSGQHEKAIENNLKSLEIAELRGDTRAAANSMRSIGMVYNKQLDYKQAEFYFNKAKETFITLKDTGNLIRVTNDFGILNKNKGNFEAAEEEYFKMLKLGQQEKFAYAKQPAYGNLGTLYFEMGQYRKGLEYSLKSYAEAQNANNKRGLSDATNTIAKCQLALGEYDEAI